MTAAAVVVTIHVLARSRPACQFTDLVPGYWPIWNIWIRPSELEDTRAAIANPNSGLCDILRYVICERCEAALSRPDPGSGP